LYYSLVAREPREPELRSGHPGNAGGAWAIQSAGAKQAGPFPEADERETPEEATPGPEGIRPAAKSSSSERKGVERTRRPRRNTAPFQEEYREFLRKYGVEYDERHL
jgi:hypothetical protein